MFSLQDAPDVIRAISRINFTKLTSFNIVLFTDVDEVKMLKDVLMEEGATHAQTGHFYVNNQPQSNSQGDDLYVHFPSDVCCYIF